MAISGVQVLGLVELIHLLLHPLDLMADADHTQRQNQLLHPGLDIAIDDAHHTMARPYRRLPAMFSNLSFIGLPCFKLIEKTLDPVHIIGGLDGMPAGDLRQGHGDKLPPVGG